MACSGCGGNPLLMNAYRCCTSPPTLSPLQTLCVWGAGIGLFLVAALGVSLARALDDSARCMDEAQERAQEQIDSVEVLTDDVKQRVGQQYRANRERCERDYGRPGE